MKNVDTVIELARRAGFAHAGALNREAVVFMPEVRDMCRADRCHSYGKNWRCPPACGSIEEATEKAAAYRRGVLVQTVAEMEDEFDYEAIEKSYARHNECFSELVRLLRKNAYDFLPMSSGACTVCEKCTYPDAPCRFPERSYSSMEAYGLWVGKVCELSGVPYYYGKNTVAFTGCVLFNEAPQKEENA